MNTTCTRIPTEYKARPGSPIDIILCKYSEAEFDQFMCMVTEGDGVAQSPKRITVPRDALLKKAWNYFVNNAGRDLCKMPISSWAQGNVTAWIMVNNILVSAMLCVECNVIKPRFNEFFSRSKSVNMEQWMKYPPGLEPFHNSKKYPCRLCNAALLAALSRETPLGYFNTIAQKYSFSSQDLLNMYKSIERGLVSDMPAKFLFAQRCHPLKVGVHEISRENWDNGKKHDRKDHKLDNCTLDLAYKNVPQRDRIPDLIAAVTQTYAATINHFSSPARVVDQMQADHLEFYVKWWTMTPVDFDIVLSRTSPREYRSQLMKLHLRTIIGVMCAKHKYIDKSERRDLMEGDEQSTAKSYFQILCDHYCKCAICYAYLTVNNNLPTDLSYNRMSNSYSHGDKNIQPVCSVHQVPNGLIFNEAMQIHECCLQTRVHVSSDARAKLIARHDALITDGIVCPYCDVERIE